MLSQATTVILSLFPPCLCWGVIFWSDAWGGQQCGGELNEGEVRVGGLHIVLGQSGAHSPTALSLLSAWGGWHEHSASVDPLAHQLWSSQSSWGGRGDGGWAAYFLGSRVGFCRMAVPFYRRSCWLAFTVPHPLQKWGPLFPLALSRVMQTAPLSCLVSGGRQRAEEGMGYPLLVSWPLSSLKELFH